MRVDLLLIVLLGITLQVAYCATISARSVPEGGYITIDSASSSFANQYVWDLNSNGVFGETGAKATHGDEIGRTVRFQTIGRDGTKFAAGYYPVYLRVLLGNTLVDSGQTSIQVTNARPVVTSAGGPYTTTGSSAQLSATASDPGGTPVTILWDLDLDGVFGETGNNAQNGDEVGSPVTFTSEVTERDRSSLVRVRASDGSLLSDIVSTRVTIPGLSSTRRCPCAAIASGNCAAVSLTDTASFSSSLGNTVLTRRSTGARVGGVFRARPVVFDTSKSTGFEFCSTFQVLANERQPATHANDVNDGGISFIITSAKPSSAPSSIGGNAGLVTRKQSTGVSIRFITTQALVQIGNTNGFPSTNAAVVAGFPSSDKHQHYFSVQYLSGIQLVRVFIDGVKVLETNYNLLDEGILGKGPVFRIYPGIVGSVSAAFSQDIVVSTNFQFCTTTLTTILPPTCAVTDCTATQTTDGCNVPVENPTNCGGVSCSTSNIPTTVCANGQCVGACASNYADCNNDRATDGCETRIDNDIYNCGGCGFSCPQINGAASCVGGVCQPVCSSGFANCDLDITNGCETNTTSDIRNCGTCGKSCALLGFSTPRCVNGLCVGNCGNPLFKDCNANATDGCETPVGSNTEQCGSCTNVCSSTNVLQRICSGGVCTPACASGFADCNLAANDGCESSVSSDVNNCGGCGVVCSSVGTSSVACVAGQCSSLCAAGNANCDNNMRNGCEVSTATNVTNCGSCGTVCSSNNVPITACSGGVCTGACATGYGNCDGNLQTNGCETDLSATITNCGSCGNICTPKTHLSNPLCVPNFSGMNPVASCGGFCDGGWAACPVTNKATTGCTSADLFDFVLGTVPTGRTLQTATTNTITFTSGRATVNIPFAFQMYQTAIAANAALTVVNGGAVYMSSVSSAQTTYPTLCAKPTYVSSTATGSVGIVMPYFSSSAFTSASYSTGGSSPNRFLRIQWNTGSGSDYFTVTFEETTNAIEFAYSFASFTTAGQNQLIGVSDLFFRSNYVTTCGTNALITGQTGPVFLRFVPSTNLAYKPQVPASFNTAAGSHSVDTLSYGGSNTITFAGSNNWVQVTLAGPWATPAGTVVSSVWVSKFGVISVTAPPDLTSGYIGNCGTNTGGYNPPRVDVGAEFFHISAVSSTATFNAHSYSYAGTRATKISWNLAATPQLEIAAYLDSSNPGIIYSGFKNSNTIVSNSLSNYDIGIQTYYKGAFACSQSTTVSASTTTTFSMRIATTSNCSN